MDFERTGEASAIAAGSFLQSPFLPRQLTERQLRSEGEQMPCVWDCAMRQCVSKNELFYFVHVMSGKDGAPRFDARPGRGQFCQRD